MRVGSLIALPAPPVARSFPFKLRRRGPRFVAEVFDGADDALAALDVVQGGLSSLGFQTLDWLTVLYEELAPARGALPRLVIVTERNSAQPVLVLPLLVHKKRRLRIARFADLGVCHYGAPILGPAPLLKPRSMRRVWRAVRRALSDIDMIRFERMPGSIGGKPNPLVTRSGVTVSRKTGHRIEIEHFVEDFIALLPGKVRREIERTGRLWQKQPTARFQRVTDGDALARAFAMLDEADLERTQHRGVKSRFEEPATRMFYERAVIDVTETGLGHMFTIEVNGEIAAAQFGILHDGVYSVLRTASVRGRWARLSPGRTLTLEVMKYLAHRGIRRFDLGPGDNAFKKRLGAKDVPLYDLILARDLAALPRALFHRLMNRARQKPALTAIYDRFLSQKRA